MQNLADEQGDVPSHIRQLWIGTTYDRDSVAGGRLSSNSMLPGPTAVLLTSTVHWQTVCAFASTIIECERIRYRHGEATVTSGTEKNKK